MPRVGRPKRGDAAVKQLQPRSWAVLRYLARAFVEADEKRDTSTPELFHWVSNVHTRTPNEIGSGIGQLRSRPRRQGGYAGPGSTIVGALTSLERAGLIMHWVRSDGLSGVAYGITREGREFLRTNVEPLREWVLCPDCVTVHWRPAGTTRAWQGKRGGRCRDLVPLVGDRWEDAVADARVKGLRK